MRSPPGRAYQTRETVRIANLLQDANFRPSQLLRDHDIRSVLNAPIAINGIVWGVLEVDATRADLFDADDERFLLGLSLVTALAVQFYEGQQERESSAEELARRLNQSDMLLTEQNHRVRNYFQLILAILAQRRKKQTDAHTRAEFDALMERVTAVALAHDQLTVGRLLTNAIKYSIKEGRVPAIKVWLKSHNDGAEATLTVSDNGPGMGRARSGSMGLQLVESLASQLSGRVDIQSSEEGTTVIVFFPIVE